MRSILLRLFLALITPTLLVSSANSLKKNAMGETTVVVVGAGIAGLAAAKKLKEKYFTVIVLEAQAKVGGRLRTDRSLGIPFDEGASWIHGPKGNPITRLALESGTKSFLTDDDNVAVYDTNGAAYADNILTSAQTQFGKALSAVQKAGNLNQSFEEVFQSLYPSLANDRLWKYMLSASLEFNTGADISKLSSKYFNDDHEFGGKDEIIVNGYDKVTDYLAQGLDIRLNTRVSAVDYSGKKIKLTANESIFHCDYVIITVPLGVLKHNAIHFTPALPTDKTTAIARVNMGNVNKFMLIWETPFWDTHLQYIGFIPETKGKFNYFLNVRKFSTANALMTFAFGNYATVTEDMPDQEIVTAIMLHLRTIYGKDIPNPTGMLRTKWGRNINSFGAYSYATNGATPADFDTLAKAVNKKIFFAGEHTNRQYPGTVHGAYLSGLHAADKIIRGRP